MTRTILNSSLGRVFLCSVIVSIVLIAVALGLWGAKEVREDAGEIFFLTLGGTLYLLACIYFFKWLGISIRDDIVERGNIGALVALCAATIALAMLYVGGSVGEGPDYSENVFSVGLAAGSFLLLWIILEAGGRISMSIAEERDLASGIRFGGFLFATGLILGRAVAGDWHSVDATIHDFVRDGWPAAVICVVALIVEALARPNPRRLAPSWPVFGVVPALVYLTMAVAWLWHIGRWEGMPK